MPELFSQADLENWLQYEEGGIDAGQHAVVERVVRGWVLSATEWAEIPDPLPEIVASWALELGGVAFENPTDQSSEMTVNVQSAWRDRKSQILAELKLWARNNDTLTRPGPRPRGRFPAALPYPDGSYPWGLRP